MTVCIHCAPLFGLDFIVDLIQNGDADPDYRRRKVDQVVDSYDRAIIVLKYLRQFIDSTCDELEQTAVRDNKIGLGSSATGLVSGVTGLTVAAIHFAAMSSAVSIVAAATVLTPVGPPLLLASIALGGTAAAASSGSEAVSYYSEPNQLANRIVALHELVHSLLKVTVTLRDALTRGHIDLDLYLNQNLQSRSSSFRDDETADVVNQREVALSCSDETENDVNGCGSSSNGDTMDYNDSLEPGVRAEQSVKPGMRVEPDRPAVVPDSAEDTILPNLDSSEESNNSKNNRNKTIPSTSTSNIRSAVTRTCTNTLKAAQVASAACGVLSVASIILEAKNMTDTVQRMKAGNRHPKVDILRAIQREMDQLPDTCLIAAQCESYLQHEAEQDELEHAADLDSTQEEEEKVAATSFQQQNLEDAQREQQLEHGTAKM